MAKNLSQSLLSYLRKKFGQEWWSQHGRNADLDLIKDTEAGAECLWRAMSADWWEWTAGSRLFFWRWPEKHQIPARDGYRPYFVHESPAYKRPQPYECQAEMRNKVTEKLSTVRDKLYITKGEVQSLTSYFWVPKGASDIRMVYDASRSGLNQALWAPNFVLPTVDMLVRGVQESTWMGDLDISEMFLNFCLHPKLQPFCGVDLKPYFKDKRVERSVLAALHDGVEALPYVCIKGLLLAMEVIRGDRNDVMNAFRWEYVKLNLPGDAEYTPLKPRLYRVKNKNDELAALILSYVDDMRAADGSEEDCWQSMHQVATTLSFLGIQTAARKTCPPSQREGAWVGSIVITDASGVGVKATQEKWEKTKGLLNTLYSWIEEGDQLDRKKLESFRGSLVYL